MIWGYPQSPLTGYCPISITLRCKNRGDSFCTDFNSTVIFEKKGAEFEDLWNCAENDSAIMPDMYNIPRRASHTKVTYDPFVCVLLHNLQVHLPVFFVSTPSQNKQRYILRPNIPLFLAFGNVKFSSSLFSASRRAILCIVSFISALICFSSSWSPTVC